MPPPVKFPERSPTDEFWNAPAATGDDPDFQIPEDATPVDLDDIFNPPEGFIAWDVPPHTLELEEAIENDRPLPVFGPPYEEG